MKPKPGERERGPFKRLSTREEKEEDRRQNW